MRNDGKEQLDDPLRGAKGIINGFAMTVLFFWLPLGVIVYIVFFRK